MKPKHEILRDLENGYLFDDGERIFSMRIKSFQVFLERLGVIGGKPVSQVLWDQMGKAAGHAALTFWKNRIHSIEDLCKVGDEILSQQGCGRLLGVEKRVEGSTDRFIVRCKGTPLSYERKTTEPSCHFMRGLMQGWVEGYLERNAASSIETKCEATGSSECVFEITFIQ
jgi:predicted hydrocarbon binding protein